MTAGHYTPPLEDSLFLLDHVLDWRRLFELPAFAHADPETAAAVLEEGARFTSEVLAPLNPIGDEHGAKLVDGRVVMPTGFVEGWRKFAEGGWPGLDLPHEYGGHALPLSVQVAFAEMINGACVSFGMLPIMLRAGTRLILEHGDRELIDRIVPRLVSGEWAGTICISEPQAGSDVGRIRTRADPRDDGSYLLTGTKIFISYGDHDLTEQILHFVLARMPEAPPGTRGISLFAVPKLRFDGGGVNGASVSRVEKKMGLKASPTCVLDLDGAIGYRIGDEHRGLQCMFTMVNLMRLEVAIQGVALAGAATSKALEYAANRPQGGDPNSPPIAIIEHADVRRMLFLMRARTEAMRALVFEAAFNLDLAAAANTADQRAEARYLAEFLLPVCKACGSEAGFEVANLAIQVFGGHGYVSDAGVEQYARDSRVMAIYEGTNGIQALDLLTRKVLRDDGIRYRVFTDRIRRDLAHHEDDTALAEIRNGLAGTLDLLDECTALLHDWSSARQRDVEAAATDYLQLAGLTAGAWMWLRMAAAAHSGSRIDNGRRALAAFYNGYLLPGAAVRRERIRTGAALLDAAAAGAVFSGN
jgi:alkylation response protein AidB-like acyl-CoA dehydrogenase